MSVLRRAILGRWRWRPPRFFRREAEKRVMVVHLPEAPIESMSRLAEGVTALATYLQGAVPDLTLEVKAFRKSDDAIQFLTTPGRCDSARGLRMPPFFSSSRKATRRLIGSYAVDARRRERSWW